MQQTVSHKIPTCITAMTVMDQHHMAIGRFDGVIEIRNIWTGEKIKEWNTFFNGDMDFIRALISTRNGTLVSVMIDGLVNEWAWEETPTIGWSHTYGYDVKSIIELPDESFVTSASMALISLDNGFAWGAENGFIRMKMMNSPPRENSLPMEEDIEEGDFTVLCLSRHHNMVAAGLVDGSVQLYCITPHFQKWKLVWAVDIHSRMLLDVRWSPDGSFIATTSADETVKILSPHDGTVMRTIQGYIWAFHTLLISPSGTKLIMGRESSLVVERLFWDLEVRLASLGYRSSVTCGALKTLFVKCKRYF